MKPILAYTYSMGEGGEATKPGKHDQVKRKIERSQSPSLRDRLSVAGQVLGIGTLVALGGLYATKHQDPGLGGLLNQNEPRNERVTTGQLFADAQLASADSSAGVEQEKVTYRQRLDLAEKEMGNQIDNPEVKKRIQRCWPLIKSAANGEGIPADLFLGQAITESKCDPEAGSRAGAAGILQTMPYIYDDEENGFDPFDPKESVDRAAEILAQEHDKFGDWSLAFWSWHIGAPRVYEAVRTYAYNLEDQIILEDIDVKPENDTPEAYEKATLIATERIRRYKDFIKEHEITVGKLYESSPVRALYTSEEWDRTWDYWARIDKSAEIVESQGLVEVVQQQ